MYGPFLALLCCVLLTTPMRSAREPISPAGRAFPPSHPPGVELRLQCYLFSALLGGEVYHQTELEGLLREKKKKITGRLGWTTTTTDQRTEVYWPAALLSSFFLSFLLSLGLRWPAWPAVCLCFAFAFALLYLPLSFLIQTLAVTPLPSLFIFYFFLPLFLFLAFTSLCLFLCVAAPPPHHHQHHHHHYHHHHHNHHRHHTPLNHTVINLCILPAIVP